MPGGARTVENDVRDEQKELPRAARWHESHAGEHRGEERDELPGDEGHRQRLAVPPNAAVRCCAAARWISDQIEDATISCPSAFRWPTPSVVVAKPRAMRPSRRAAS